MKFSFYSSLFFAFLFISGCGLVTKPYSSVGLSEEQQKMLYRDYIPVDSVSIGTILWSDFFTDSYLQALIQRGLSQNHDLQNMILRVYSAENTLKRTKHAFFPSLDFSPQLVYNRASEGAIAVPTTINLQNTTVSLGFSTTWELEIWGKLSSAKRASQAAWMGSIASQNAVKTALIANIADAYYTLLALDEQLLITESTVESRSSMVETLGILMESGQVTGADVVQAEANLHEGEISVLELRQAIRELENSLCVLTAQSLQSIPRGTLASQTLNRDLKIGLPVFLLSNRPDVQLAEQVFREAFELNNVARASFYPSIRLSAASAGLSALTGRSLLASSNIFINLAAGITQPIFQRRTLTTNYKNAQLAQQQAFNTFQKTLLIAGQEVTNSLYSYQLATEKQVIRQQQIASLEQALAFRMELLTYSSSTNYMDVLGAEQGLLFAQLSRVGDRLGELRAIISLYRSLGGGVN